jgi:hypothetical protein
MAQRGQLALPGLEHALHVYLPGVLARGHGDDVWHFGALAVHDGGVHVVRPRERRLRGPGGLLRQPGDDEIEIAVVERGE